MRSVYAYLSLAALLVSSAALSAQQISTEAGKYERKSVTYLNALWLMDQSVRDMPAQKVGEVLDKVKAGLTMKRFDYNPVPEFMVTDFVNQANALVFPASVTNAPSIPGISVGSDPMLDSIAQVMERTVVPKILEVVDAAKEMRAANLTSEQQRNSFMADKAKSLGITMEDIDKVMNSAYIFVPLARRFLGVLSDSTYNASIELGIVMFRISIKDSVAKAVPVVRKFTYSQGNSRLGKNYAAKDGLIDYREFAFRSAVKNAVRNLVVAVQEIPDFRLSGQIVEKRFGSVGFDLGKNEGIILDDKYRIVEYVEEADGKIKQQNNGWIRVTSVGDSAKKEGYKSKACIVSGRPFVGAVLSEYPRIPIDISLRYQMVDVSQTIDDSASNYFTGLKLNPSVLGFNVDAQYNFGRRLGLRQFFVDIGFGMGTGTAEGWFNRDPLAPDPRRLEIKTLSTMSIDVSVLKKFYVRRLALDLSVGFGYEDVAVYTKSSVLDTALRLDNASIGLVVGGGLEFALSPALNFGAGVQYRMLAESADWTRQSRTSVADKWGNSIDITDKTPLSHSGLTYRVYFTWSPPALPFDPVDMIRGNMGI